MATEKRLTEKHYNGKGYYMKCSGLCRFDGHCANCDELVKIVDRLGEYEDKAEQTVDAVEVVHGRWLYDSGSGKYFCSACDEYALSFRKDTFGLGEVYEVCLTDYCPNCGAKMDGDVNG